MSEIDAAGSNLPGRERMIILAALAGVTTVSWVYLWLLAGDMAGMAQMTTSAMPAAWSATDFILMFVMWWVMMVGMMVPSTAPMILTFATVNRRRRSRGLGYVPTGIFASGYVIAWGVFSLVATLAQWGFEQAALMSPMMVLTNSLLGGLLFVGAGLYQLTPLKHACLNHCRSPLDFVLNHWHEGKRGALAMGIGHGLYCLGCCWVAMTLLFVGGVMNLLWVAAIAVFVFIEKLFPAGDWIAKGGGVAMLGFGAWLSMRSLM